MTAVDVTMDVMQRENTPKRSAERGNQLRNYLEGFKQAFPFIGDVRGMGLMQGIEFVEDRKTKEPSPKKRPRSWKPPSARGCCSARAVSTAM